VRQSWQRSSNVSAYLLAQYALLPLSMTIVTAVSLTIIFR